MLWVTMITGRWVASWSRLRSAAAEFCDVVVGTLTMT
jgi:hypothetical protein